MLKVLQPFDSHLFNTQYLLFTNSVWILQKHLKTYVDPYCWHFVTVMIKVIGLRSFIFLKMSIKRDFSGPMVQEGPQQL